MVCGGRRHKVVAVGGTFDILHVGHMALLVKALNVGEKVIVGVTSDDFARSYKKHEINPYAARVRQIKEFAKLYNACERVEIVTLNDMAGPAATSPEIEALVVSTETVKGALLINSERVANKLKPLKIYVVHMVKARDGNPVNVTRIRKGEVDRYGNPVSIGKASSQVSGNTTHHRKETGKHA